MEFAGREYEEYHENGGYDSDLPQDGYRPPQASEVNDEVVDGRPDPEYEEHEDDPEVKALNLNPYEREIFDKARNFAARTRAALDNTSILVESYATIERDGELVNIPGTYTRGAFLEERPNPDTEPTRYVIKADIDTPSVRRVGDDNETIAQLVPGVITVTSYDSNTSSYSSVITAVNIDRYGDQVETALSILARTGQSEPAINELQSSTDLDILGVAPLKHRDHMDLGPLVHDTSGWLGGGNAEGVREDPEATARFQGIVQGGLGQNGPDRQLRRLVDPRDSKDLQTFIDTAPNFKIILDAWAKNFPESVIKSHRRHVFPYHR